MSFVRFFYVEVFVSIKINKMKKRLQNNEVSSAFDTFRIIYAPDTLHKQLRLSNNSLWNCPKIKRSILSRHSSLNAELRFHHQILYAGSRPVNVSLSERLIHHKFWLLNIEQRRNPLSLIEKMALLRNRNSSKMSYLLFLLVLR